MNDKFYDDKVSADYIKRKGWVINQEGKIQLTKDQADTEVYMGRSITNPALKTLMVPGLKGCTLLIEGQHFEIV